MVAQFDEDEYNGDSYRKVTVTAMTLKVKDGEDITTDVAMLFGSDAEVACVDHKAATGVTAKDDKCVNITLAVDLMPATYVYSITGSGHGGQREDVQSVEFKVVEAKPFELDLKPGVNLVSIPAMPRDDGGMLDVMLADAPVSTVLTYDSMAAMSGREPVADGNQGP